MIKFHKNDNSLFLYFKIGKCDQVDKWEIENYNKKLSGNELIVFIDFFEVVYFFITDGRLFA
jgi:hypothetical protein